VTVRPAARIITADTPNEAIMLPTMAVYVHSHEPGERADLHTHDEHHVLVMRSGRMRWTVEGQRVDAGAGDVIVVPAGIQHGFEVLGDDAVKLLCIETPNPELAGQPDPADAAG
jgi:quercetin dioxygenase-like cupin family protein